MREDILQVKLEKLENIKNFGMEAYPEKTERDFCNGQVLEQFDNLIARV